MKVASVDKQKPVEMRGKQLLQLLSYLLGYGK